MGTLGRRLGRVGFWILNLIMFTMKIHQMSSSVVQDDRLREGRLMTELKTKLRSICLDRIKCYLMASRSKYCYLLYVVRRPAVAKIPFFVVAEECAALKHRGMDFYLEFYFTRCSWLKIIFFLYISLSFVLFYPFCSSDYYFHC